MFRTVICILALGLDTTGAFQASGLGSTGWTRPTTELKSAAVANEVCLGLYPSHVFLRCAVIRTPCPFQANHKLLFQPKAMARAEYAKQAARAKGERAQVHSLKHERVHVTHAWLNLSRLSLDTLTTVVASTHAPTLHRGYPPAVGEWCHRIVHDRSGQLPPYMVVPLPNGGASAGCPLDRGPST